MNEFEMIQAHFLPLTMGRGEALGLRDDAAVLSVPAGVELVVSSDALCAGTHFLKDEAPAHIAHKALRANLSDMAAMGARPYCYQMSVAFSELPDEAWVRGFCEALLADNVAFDVFCSGGDTSVVDGGMVISLTMMGLVRMGGAVKRFGARAGDLVVLSGPIGAAAVGVGIVLGALDVKNAVPFLEACHRPMPRIGMSDLIACYARAAVDISDGLIADLGHICMASNVGARLDLNHIPFTTDTQALLDAGVVSYEDLLSGGEDYEIAMAVAPDDFEAFEVAAKAKGVALSVIGIFVEGDHVEVLDGAGEALEFERSGWTHF